MTKSNYDLTLFSPAKVNLFFRVLKKRNDGYHEIASLMQAVDFGDTLFFSRSRKDYFSCSDKTLSCDKTNLVLKAVDLFKSITNRDFGLSIHLEKKIPMSAGLGGGSSNAATTLYALNKLFDTHLTLSELKDMGKELGADVPFFFSSGSAYCTGIGECLEEVKGNPLHFTIVKPKNLSLSTPHVYKNCTVNAISDQDPKTFLDLYKNDLNRFIQSAVNDLECPAFNLEPKLVNIKKNLKMLGYEKVIMTGSGTAFVCYGDLDKVNLDDLQCYKVKSIRKEPNSWFIPQ